MHVITRPRIVIATALFALGLGLSPAPAHAKKHDGGRAKLDKICAEISCSDDQKQEIAEVFRQLHIDIKTDRKAAKQLKQQLAAEWVKDKPSERVLANLSAKLEAHERNIADRRLEAMLELHELLDAKQREQVAKQLFKGKGKGKGKGEGKGEGKKGKDKDAR